MVRKFTLPTFLVVRPLKKTLFLCVSSLTRSVLLWFYFSSFLVLFNQSIIPHLQMALPVINYPKRNSVSVSSFEGFSRIPGLIHSQRKSLDIAGILSSHLFQPLSAFEVFTSEEEFIDLPSLLISSKKVRKKKGGGEFLPPF